MVAITVARASSWNAGSTTAAAGAVAPGAVFGFDIEFAPLSALGQLGRETRSRPQEIVERDLAGPESQDRQLHRGPRISGSSASRRARSAG